MYRLSVVCGPIEGIYWRFSANTFTVVHMTLETLDFPIIFLRVGMDNFWKHTMVYISLYPTGIAIPLVTEVGVKHQYR